MLCASRHTDFPHTSALAAFSATAESLATSGFERVTTLLCSASSTVVRTAGATFAGGSYDGGVINNGGESNSLLFQSLGGFVNVGPGGFGGGKMFPRGGGDLFGKGMNAAPGTGEVSAAQEGATILGSASVSSVSSRPSGLGPHTRRGVLVSTLTPLYVEAESSLLYLSNQATLEGVLVPQSA